MTAPGAAGQAGTPDARCSEEGCWYTLPVVDGLIVAHSKAGTLDVCEGGGRPPLNRAELAGTPDMERLAEALRGHRYDAVGMICECGVLCGIVADRLTREQHLARALLPVVDAMKREAQAEALEAAARADRTTVAKLSPVERLTCYLVKVEDLVVRAAALRAGDQSC